MIVLAQQGLLNGKSYGFFPTNFTYVETDFYDSNNQPEMELVSPSTDNV